MSGVMGCFSQVVDNPSPGQSIGTLKGIEIQKPIQRNVVGPSGSFGVVLQNKQAKITLDAIASQEAKRDLENELAEKKKKEEMENFRVNFWLESDDHALLSKIKNFVDIGMKRAEDDLLEKKNKLKVALLEEEVGLTHEFIEKAQLSADHIYEQKKSLANEIEGRQKLKGAKQAQEAYDRIFRESSDEYRRNLFLENKKYCTKINEFQMKDKIVAQMKEKEEEQMWMRVMDKLERAKAEGITGDREEINKTRTKNYGFSEDILKKQLLGQRRTKEFEQELKQEEMEFWKKMNELFKEDQVVLRRREALAKEKRRQAILDQIEENRRNRQKAEEEERVFDTEMRKQNERDIADEKAQIKDERMAERRELDTFKDSVDQIKRANELEEKELEALIAEEMRKIDRTRKCGRDLARKARETLLRDVVQNRNKQIQENKRKAEVEKQEKHLLAEYSNFRWKQNDMLDKVKEKEVVETQEKHLTNLMQQFNYEKELQRRETEQNRVWLDEKKERERELEEKSRIIFTEPRRGLQHPFIYAFQSYHC